MVQSQRDGIFHFFCSFVGFVQVFSEVFLETGYQFGGALQFLSYELWGIQKSGRSHELKQRLTIIETFVVYFGLQAIKQKYLVDTLSHPEFHLDVLRVAAAKQPIFVQLHELRVQHQAKKGTQSTIRFIEPTALELSIVCSYVEINLFLVVDSVGSHVVIQNVVFFLEFHEFHDRVHGVPLLEYEQEIDISMQLLLGQGDVGLYFETDGTDEFIDLVSYFSVLLGCQFLSVFESVASHSIINKFSSFFYIPTT